MEYHCPNCQKPTSYMGDYFNGFVPEDPRIMGFHVCFDYKIEIIETLSNEEDFEDLILGEVIEEGDMHCPSCLEDIIQMPSEIIEHMSPEHQETAKNSYYCMNCNILVMKFNPLGGENL